MPPRQRKVSRTVTIKSLNFQNPEHVRYFKSLPVEEKRLYVGHYIELSDLTRFTQALLHFRQIFPNIETTKLYVKQNRALDAVRFIPSDYTSQSSHRGEMLLEHAVRADAQNFDFQSQAILKKVLGDIVLLKRQKKQVTVIPQGVALGHTIVEYAGAGYINPTKEEREHIRREVLHDLLTHPVIKDSKNRQKFMTQILATHHHHGENYHRLNAYTRVAHGNTSIENLMRKLRITKDTATPINVFTVKYNTNRNRSRASIPTHNSNPLSLNPEERGAAYRVSPISPMNGVQQSTGTQPLPMSQVNSNNSRRSNNNPNRMNESNGAKNKVQQSVDLINGAFKHANTLARNMSNDLNSVEARRSYQYGFNLAQTIIQGNKLPQNDIMRLIQKGNYTKKQIEAKEATLKREGKRPRTSQGQPIGQPTQSTSNLSNQFRG